MANIVVGIIIAALLVWACLRTYRSMKNNSCPGCAGGCSDSAKTACKGGAGHNGRIL